MSKIEFTIKNEEKGFYGCFSKAGKGTVEMLSNIKNKDMLIYEKEDKSKKKNAMVNFLKRNGYHNIYGDTKHVNYVVENELDDSAIEEVNEEVDIFKKVEELNDKKEDNKGKRNKVKNKKKRLKIKYFHRLKAELYRYHDLHMANHKPKKPFKTPDCTKYNPNKEYVMKKILISPDFKTKKGRTPLFGVDNTKYYLDHEDPLKNIGHTFIDMRKQTMRGDLINIS